MADLEREFAAHRSAAEASLAARDAELRRLRERVAAHEARRRRPRDYRNPAFDTLDAAPAPNTPVPGNDFISFTFY